MEFQNMMIGAGGGLLAGAIAAASGWKKNVPSQDFDVTKFAQTVILGGVTGAVAGATGMNLTDVQYWMASFGLPLFVENWVKVGVRRVKLSAPSVEPPSETTLEPPKETPPVEQPKAPDVTPPSQ